MKLTSYTHTPHGIVIQTDQGTRLRLEAFCRDILRLSYTRETFSDATSDLVTATAQDIPFTVEEQGAYLTFSTGTAAVEIKKTTFAVRFLRDGKELTRLSHWGMQLRDTTITVPHYTADRTTADKLRHTGTDELPGFKFYLSFDFAPDEQIYGLGQYGTGAFNRRDWPVYLYQTNNFAPVPFFVSSRGYGVLVDTGAFSSFTRDTFGTTFYTDAVEMGDYYFIASTNGDDAVRGYRTLTGAVPMMPKWLFGYAQSKERYATQQELLDVVSEYRRRQVPLDLIVQDWSYWPEDTWSDKSFDASRYPDPTAMCEELHRQHTHAMISVWPNTRGGDCFRELFEKDQLMTDEGTFGSGGVYNVFDAAACDTYWDQLERGIFRHGFDAWWCDASEPFEPCYGAYIEADEAKAVALDTYKHWMDSRRINLFSLLHSRNVYTHQRAVCEDKRVVNLTRSGYAGQQRYATIVWSGDIEGSFWEMKKQIAEGVNFSASGLPYWSLDIGGFWAKAGDARFNAGSDYQDNTDPGYRELYTRWIQFGCFLPVFRSHGTCFAREIWCFGDEGGMFYDVVRQFIELRYRLIPYLYSTAWQVTRHGDSFLRPLAFDFAEDPRALAQDESYLFGHAFLVSPVTTPQYYEGADMPLDAPKTKDVYLPAGADWYDFWTEQRCGGGQTVTVDTPIDRMPLFVRAGSIVPTTAVMQYVDEIPDAPYTITVYPGADAVFTVYEDGGDGYAYESGAYAEYDLAWDDTARTLTVSARRGGFDGMCAVRELQVRIVGGGERILTYAGEQTEVAF